MRKHKILGNLLLPTLIQKMSTKRYGYIEWYGFSARYVLLLDRFFEIGDDRYTWMAKRVRTSINKFLLTGNENHHLNYSIEYSLKQFCTFWKFEQIIKRRILGGFTFSYNEIRHFNLFKSSDAQQSMRVFWMRSSKL